MTEHEEETSEEVKRPLREDSGPGLLGAAGAAAASGSRQVRIPAAAPPSRARQPPARGRRGGDARTAPQLLQTPRAQRACDTTRTWHVPRSMEGLGGAALPAGSRAPRALPVRRRPGAASRAADPGGHRTVRRPAAHTITKLHSAGTDSTACGPRSRTQKGQGKAHVSMQSRVTATDMGSARARSTRTPSSGLLSAGAWPGLHPHVEQCRLRPGVGVGRGRHVAHAQTHSTKDTRPPVTWPGPDTGAHGRHTGQSRP